MGAGTKRTTEIWNDHWAHNHTKSNLKAHWNSKEKKLADDESASSNALGWIVLDLDICVRFSFNGFKINFVLSICIRFG